MKAIGIDIGTTSICGIVIDAENGNVIKSVTKNSDSFLFSSAEWEKTQSVEKIISIAKDILDSLLDADIAAIGVSGQMHGILYIDKDGNALSPLYTWQDGRGNLPYCNTTYAKYLKSFSGYGNVTDFYNGINHITPKEAVGYCTIHDYFVMKLCSMNTPIIHSSNAASFGLYDIANNRFDYDFKFEVINDYESAGKYKGVPVSIAIGDNQASVFSTLTSNDGVLLNVGTGSQISIISDSPIYGENIETRPYFEGKYLVVGSALCGGRAYSLLKNFYSEIFKYYESIDDKDIYNIMNEMLKSANAPLTVDTRFAGTRANADAKGAILNITTENFSPENLTLGVLEGMANELYEMYLAMGEPRCGIVASGNGARKNDALLRVFEKKFKARPAVPQHMEEAAFGAALFALISSGIFENAKEAQRIIKYL